MGLSRLNGWPARSPAGASPLASRPDTHGSGPTWIATPSSYRTLTDYSWPVSRSTTKSRGSEPVSPVPQADGHDEPGLIGELVPRLAAVVENVAVGGEDPVGDPVLAHVLPEVLDGVQLRRLGRKRHEGDGGGDHKFLRLMPAGLVHEDEGMRPGCDRLRNLLQVQGHALRGAAGQNQAGALARSGADRAEDVGRGGPLVLRGGWARAAFGPAPGDLVLLPNPRLIGEPDL